MTGLDLSVDEELSSSFEPCLKVHHHAHTQKSYAHPEIGVYELFVGKQIGVNSYTRVTPVRTAFARKDADP